jgi:hypothetical protein
MRRYVNRNMHSGYDMKVLVSSICEKKNTEEDCSINTASNVNP